MATQTTDTAEQPAVDAPIKLSEASLAILDGATDISGNSIPDRDADDQDADADGDDASDDVSDDVSGDDADEVVLDETEVDSQDDDSEAAADAAGTKNESASQESSAKWSESDRRLARKYDLNDEDLAAFGSAAAMHRAIDILDRRAAVATNAGGAGGLADEASDAADAQSASTPVGLKKIDVEKLRAEFGDSPETMEVIESLAQTQDFMLQKLEAVEKYEQSVMRQQHAANDNAFHTALDAIPEIYGSSVKDGKPVSLTKSQESARLAVRDAAETLYAGILAKGGTVPGLSTLLEQAINVAHGKQIAESAQKRNVAKRQESLRSQSRQRRSPGRKAGSMRRVSNVNPDSAEAIAADPEITEFFRNAQIENGA